MDSNDVILNLTGCGGFTRQEAEVLVKTCKGNQRDLERLIGLRKMPAGNLPLDELPPMPEIPLIDFVMACRFGYYCHAISYVPDAEYDALERQAREDAPFDHPIHEVGCSDMQNYEHYPSHVRALSLYLRLREIEESGSCPQCRKPARLGDHSKCQLKPQTQGNLF